MFSTRTLKRVSQICFGLWLAAMLAVFGDTLMVARAQETAQTVAQIPIRAGTPNPGDLTLEGTFSIMFGGATPDYYLGYDYEGKATNTLLYIDEALSAKFEGLLSINGQRVKLTGVFKQTRNPYPLFVVSSLEAYSPSGLVADIQPLVTLGNKRYVNILCQFNDSIATIPASRSYVNSIFSDSTYGLNSYFKEISVGSMNLDNWQTVGWLILPEARAGYVDTTINTAKLAEHCTAQADPYVNFRDFYGINIMVNVDMDGTGRGWSMKLNLDGENRNWGVTFLPPWTYVGSSSNYNNGISAMAHEMLHSMRVTHTRGSDGTDTTDDLDVMSNPYYLCTESNKDKPNIWNAKFGCLPQYTNAYNMERLGWIPSTRRELIPNTVTEVGYGYKLAVASARTTTSPSEYRWILKLDAGTAGDYIVEARHESGRDKKLGEPGRKGGVIIYKRVYGDDATAARTQYVATLNSLGESYRIDQLDSNGNIWKSIEIRRGTVIADTAGTVLLGYNVGISIWNSGF